MKNQKIRAEVIQHVMPAAAGAARNSRIDLVLERYNLAQNETQLKAICRAMGGECVYW